MAHRWSALLSLSPCIHPSTLGGWAQAQEEERTTGHRQQSVNSLSAQPAGSERQGESLHLFPYYSAHIRALLCPPWAHAWTITSLPDTQPSRLSNPEKTWLSELLGLTLRAAGGRKKTETVRSRTTWGCVILERRGGLWVGGRAAQHGVALLIHTLNKHDDCHWRCKWNTVLLRLF